MVNVFITIDTECSLGGAWSNPDWSPVGAEPAILGKIGSSCYGTPLMMDILDQNDLRATFFTEVFARDIVDASALCEAYRSIQARGHDVQLHLHPAFRYFHLVKQGMLRRDQLPRDHDMDLIGAWPATTQLEMLKTGKSIFEEIFQAAPVAFRAGVYGASAATLDCLEAVAIPYDSSFNSAYLGKTCLMDAPPTNAPWRHGKVWEIPVTVFQTGAWGIRGLKPLEVSAVSSLEMKQVLEHANRSGSTTVTIILHSFGFLKRADVQFRKMRPDRIVIRRFEQLCRYLRLNRSRFRVSTFSEMPVPAVDGRELPLARLGVLAPASRKLVQAANRIYWL